VNTSSIYTSSIYTSSITANSTYTNSLINTGTTEVQQISEVIASTLIVGSLTPLQLSWLNGAIYNMTTLSNNPTIRLNNVPETANRALTATFLINQGGTAYMISSMSINNVGISIKWPNAVVPAPTASRTEIETFTMFRIAGNWQVIGQLNSFG
jgi:hypothetical protein